MELAYTYSDGTKFTKLPSEHFFSGKTSDPNEIKGLMEKLSECKRSVSVYIDGLSDRGGSLDFYCLEDRRIEMEILQGGNDDFAVLDIEMAKRIVDVLFKSSGEQPIRAKLQDLPIKWLC